jgi:hypothetical protein
MKKNPYLDQASAHLAKKFSPFVMLDLRSLPRTRFGGIQTSSRRTPDQVRGRRREPSRRLGPGFHRKPWIPAGVYPDENRGRNDAFTILRCHPLSYEG